MYIVYTKLPSHLYLIFSSLAILEKLKEAIYGKDIPLLQILPIYHIVQYRYTDCIVQCVLYRYSISIHCIVYNGEKYRSLPILDFRQCRQTVNCNSTETQYSLRHSISYLFVVLHKKEGSGIYLSKSPSKFMGLSHFLCFFLVSTMSCS